MISERTSDAAGLRDLLVLGYHGVSDAAASPQTVTRAALRQQVAELLERGYVGTTFNRAVHDASQTQRLVVTFDDGERCVLDHGLPVLEEFGVPATVFVPVATIGQPGMLDWEDLALLVEAGWEVGSHGVTHVSFTGLDDASLDAELRGSRKAIEDRLGQPCRSVAYPYSHVDDRVRAAARRAGYTAGCRTNGSLVADVLDWPRVGVHGHDGGVLFRLKTSRFGRVVRGSWLSAPLERTARALRSARARF